jgi:hypothetical protein
VPVVEPQWVPAAVASDPLFGFTPAPRALSLPARAPPAHS